MNANPRNTAWCPSFPSVTDPSVSAVPSTVNNGANEMAEPSRQDPPHPRCCCPENFTDGDTEAAWAREAGQGGLVRPRWSQGLNAAGAARGGPSNTASFRAGWANLVAVSSSRPVSSWSHHAAEMTSRRHPSEALFTREVTILQKAQTCHV